MAGGLVTMEEKMRIAHVSDLHLASPYFVPSWSENVIDIINEQPPDLLVLTGDLTENGYSHEYTMARALIDEMKARDKVILPGNHDARNLGYEIFEDSFSTRFPEFKNEDVALIGLDSTEPDLDDGHVGRENYWRVRESMRPDRLRVLALHHHLIPIPGTGRERQIPTDAGDLLGLCKELRIHFVLSGHKHLPWIWKLESTYFITAGTATTRRLKGKSYPSFNLLDIEDESAVVTEVNVETKQSREVLRTTECIKYEK